LLVLAFLILIKCIHVVPQAHVYIVERLGAFRKTWPLGLHVRVPFIDRIAVGDSITKKGISLK